MIPQRDLHRAYELLQADLLGHVVTLKMLNSCSARMGMRVVEGTAGWALLTWLPVAASGWDRKEYPGVDAVVFVDGTDQDAKRELLREAARTPIVLKTGDEDLKRWLDAGHVRRQGE